MVSVSVASSFGSVKKDLNKMIATIAIRVIASKIVINHGIIFFISRDPPSALSFGPPQRGQSNEDTADLTTTAQLTSL
ncbi:hypothetical protein D3C78_1626850 [compost metagenome]